MSLILHCWEEECAIYNQYSGDVHLLAKADAQLLQLIVDQTIEQNVLLKKIMADYTLNAEESQLFLEDLYLQYRTLGILPQ